MPWIIMEILIGGVEGERQGKGRDWLETLLIG